jgi:4'-phosphopantetheinyl transferase
MFSGLSEDEFARAKSFHRIGDALRFATVRAPLRERLADRGRCGHRDACNGFRLAFGRRPCAHPQERTHIEQLNAHAKLEAFYEIWVTKESILKAAGVGLTEDLQDLSVSPERDGSTSRQYRLPGNAACFQAATLPAPSGYAACVAWE